MIKLKKGTKLFIAVFIVMLSFFASMKLTDITNLFVNKTKIQKNTETEKVFNLHSAEKKMMLYFNSDDKALTVKAISKIVTKFDLNTIISIQNTNLYSAVIKGSIEDYDSIIEGFRKVEGLESERIIHNTTGGFEINVEEHLQNKIATKTKLIEMIEKSNLPDRVNQFNIQLEKIQLAIDSLRSNQSKISDNKNNFVINISVAYQQYSGKTSLNQAFQFIISFVITLILMFILFIILYYFTQLFLVFMKLVGIETAHGTTTYGYNRHKKVKRVYKEEEDKVE